MTRNVWWMPPRPPTSRSSVDGTDTLLMAADHALRRELSRRIRDDLIHLGIVRPGPACASPTAPWPVPGT